MKKSEITLKHLVAQLVGVADNEAVAGIYAIASLILMMLVATSDSLGMILIAVANLYLSVRNLERIEERRNR